jgi:hypothetical protein
MVSRLAMSKTTMFSGFFGTSTVVSSSSGSASSSPALRFRSQVKETIPVSGLLAVSAAASSPQADRARTAARGRATAESGRTARMVLLRN